MNGDVSKVFLHDYFNTVQLVMDTDITQNFKGKNSYEVNKWR
jgi:hypothetical protein